MSPKLLNAVRAIAITSLAFGCASGCGSKNGGGGAGGAAPADGGAGTGGTTTLVCNGAGGSTGAGGSPSCASNPADYANPFLDPCQPIEDRISNLLSLLTPAEKQSLLGQNQPAIPRLGVPGFSTFTEGLHGVGWSDSGSGAVPYYMVGTQFPQAFGLAESWDPGVMKTVGAVTGYEARVYNARGINSVGRGPAIVVRAPLVDLGRDPRWGRTEESYGEDPFLAGELAKGYLSGLQGTDPRYLLAASTLKHWLANNNEANRAASSSNVDERNLREYYTAPFEAAIRGGHAQGIMTAYNQIDGVPSAVSPLLKSLLVGEWGFDGLISTDATGPQVLVTNQHYFPTLEAAVAAIIQGGTGTLVQDRIATQIANAYAQGLYGDADMDAALRPVLRVRFRLGDLDPASYVPYKQIASTETPWNGDDAKAKALDVARRTVVLLKNDGATLPLDRAAITSVAVIGPRADSVVRDWYGGTAPYVVTPRQGIAAKLGPGVTVRYAADDTAGAATAAAAQSDVAVVFVGNHPTCGINAPWGTCPTPYDGREAVDRTYIALEPTQLALVKAVVAANPRTIVVLVSGYPMGIGWINDNVPAVVHVTNSAQELGTAIADVLFGDYNPAGRTTTTWYQTETDIPTAITDYDIRQGTTYWYFAGTPLYDFGHGLSYSSFAYSPLTLSADSLSAAGSPACGAIQVAVDVTNGSTRAGEEVVQLYVAYPGSSLGRPRQQLRGFQRVAIAAGETRHVTFALSAADLRYWDSDNHAFAVEANGMVEVQIGAASRDIRGRGVLRVTP